MTEVFYIKEFPGNAYRWVGEGDDMSLQTVRCLKTAVLTTNNGVKLAK